MLKWERLHPLVFFGIIRPETLQNLPTRAGRTRMTGWIEILFNMLWIGVLVACAVIAVVIMKKRDPYDDGPALEEEHD